MDNPTYVELQKRLAKLEEEKTQLRIQAVYLERLFNSAPEAIVWHDNNDVIVNVNDEFTRMFGYSREEAIGRQINDLVTSERYRKEAAEISARIGRGEWVELESRRDRKDGTMMDVSILCAPIFYNNKQVGDYAIYRDITERKKAEEARLQAETEARTARNIQMNFLPGSDPVVPGYAIAGKSIPALNVGGDYYDFIRFDEHRLAVGLGDVSGHGLSSALVMANLQATIRSQASFDPDPARCLERANKLLYHSTDSHTFVSLFYGMLDTTSHTLTYANAGQNWPMIFSPAGAPRRLVRHGLVLGVREDSAYEEEEINIDAGDFLILFSDGVIEAMNIDREQFGDERLIDTVRRAANSSAKGAIDAIISAVSAHAGKASQADDMTVVVLERK